ncbi:hypothetical protein [Clostridium sulfidigenes]|nr:hypothetical protein [Clostridium sulfidigenes]
MIILKSLVSLNDEQISKDEKELSERIGEKVIIIPCKYEIVEINNKKCRE